MLGRRQNPDQPKPRLALDFLGESDLLSSLRAQECCLVRNPSFETQKIPTFQGSSILGDFFFFF